MTGSGSTFAFPEKKRRLGFLCVGILAMTILAIPPCHGQENPPGKRSALTSIGVVEDVAAARDPDDPGAGGGFDAENYFQNLLVDKVGACTANVLSEFLVWSQAQSLPVSKTVEGPTSVLAYATLATPPGVLELAYRFNATQKRARATLFFYSVDGAKHEPAAIEALLTQYKVASLQDKVRTAIACH